MNTKYKKGPFCTEASQAKEKRYLVAHLGTKKHIKSCDAITDVAEESTINTNQKETAVAPNLSSVYLF